MIWLILAVYHNMFKLQLQEENGLKTQTLSFHLNNAALTITLHSPWFSGTQDKVDNSLKRCFVGRCGLSSSLFLHKLRLELFQRRHLHLEALCTRTVQPSEMCHSWVKRKIHYRDGSKTSSTHSQKSTESNTDGWSQVSFHGKENPPHSIRTRCH